MPEPFKELINAAAVARLGAQLHAGTPSFPVDAFVSVASAGLGSLELKARVRHVAAALHRLLPPDWPEALSVLLAGAGPPLPDADAVSSNFHVWPLLQVVETHGLAHPQASLAALRELTRRFSAEFAVRPYIAQHPALTWPVLHRWAVDADVHVRRLASEGSRPRLPWGAQLRACVADPAPGLALLERLKDDPEVYVRRSVANHLNDISKDHPSRAVAVGTAWMQGGQASPERAWVVRHALRSLLKAGHSGALAAMGYAAPAVVLEDLTLSPAVVRYGPAGAVTVSLRLRSGAAVPQRLMVDLVVRYARQRGLSAPQVFKGTVVVLPPGEVWSWSRALAMRPVTTRRHHPGRHQVSVQVNGEALGSASFTLEGGD